MKGKKLNYTDTYVTVHQYKVPLRIHIERRSNIRIAVGKDTVLLRIPVFSSGQIDKHIATATDWLKKVCKEQPQLLEKYHISKYAINREVTILGRDKYELEVSEHNSELTGEIRLKDNKMLILVPNGIDDFDKRVMARNLISKLMARKYKKLVEERIKYWNDRYFQKDVKGVTLRYNSTNWGSCSTTSKINISTRSLLLPMEVFDYILVHELSHLVEMNHSDRFWKVVERVMPDYEKAEKWITDNAMRLDF
ncbi:MAG: M48 family metallopeptidase [Saprospiraceae bacterium]|nr:M48 family metallopeptidase [Saprospiraceae bacterium]MBK8851264.1 M48 family metallopeptidase [Saprospiraceae bacterium]